MKWSAGRYNPYFKLFSDIRPETEGVLGELLAKNKVEKCFWVIDGHAKIFVSDLFHRYDLHTVGKIDKKGGGARLISLQDSNLGSCVEIDTSPIALSDIEKSQNVISQDGALTLFPGEYIVTPAMTLKPGSYLLDVGGVSTFIDTVLQIDVVSVGGANSRPYFHDTMNIKQEESRNYVGFTINNQLDAAIRISFSGYEKGSAETQKVRIKAIDIHRLE